ncbi:hypothetical protein V1511DRAFT_479332 [Dipodascopsis uninucleata]
MSSADVRDVLDLPSHQASAESRPPLPKRQKTEGKKLEGIHRELHNLLGENTPAVPVIESRFKEKPNWMKKPSPWVWTGFKNSARSDDLELYHWVRGAPQNDEYPFAKYNKSVDVPTYTKEEYDECLADAAWTPRETNYLFELCREYDLRWFVIQDRYEYEAEENEPRSIRTLEDMKERYYGCCRKLMEYKRDRGDVEWTPRDLELFNSLKYDKDREIARKQHLERLLSRAPSEIAEEERLILEYRKLQEKSKKLVEERKDLLRLLESPQTSQSFAQFQSNQGLAQLASNLLASDKNRRRKISDQAANVHLQQAAAQKGMTPQQLQLLQAQQQAAQQAQAEAQLTQQQGLHSSSSKHQQIQTPSGRSQASPAAQPISKAALAMSATAKKVAKRVPPGDEPAYGVSLHDKLIQGVYLRSTRISTLKPTVQSKVSSVLAELGISPKLTMPTAKVCERFESLQNAISLLIEAKKQADKLEAEVRVLKTQKALSD